jgi:hypothetical protein
MDAGNDPVFDNDGLYGGPEYEFARKLGMAAASIPNIDRWREIEHIVQAMWRDVGDGSGMTWDDAKPAVYWIWRTHKGERAAE